MGDELVAYWVELSGLIQVVVMLAAMMVMRLDNKMAEKLVETMDDHEVDVSAAK